MLTNWSVVEPAVEEEDPAEEHRQGVPQPAEEPEEELSEGHPGVLGVFFVELRFGQQVGSWDVLLQQAVEENWKGGPGYVEQPSILD